MKKIQAFLLCGTIAMMAASAAPATTYVFATTLTGAKEVPPNPSTATGSISVQFDDVTNLLTVQEMFSGLTTAATGAHIHCCAGTTATAPIAVGFNAFPGATGGTYSMSFDLANSAVYTSAFLMASGGTVSGARTALINGLLGGQAYANIHDATYPGGEIRGQLGLVPEPASWAMMIGGFGLVGATLRRQKAARAIA